MSDLSIHQYQVRFTFDVTVKEETSARQLNRLWNEMAETAQESFSVEGVDLAGKSAISIKIKDETDAMSAERSGEVFE